jgi:hypothetical protein
MDALRLTTKPVNRRIIIDLPPEMDVDTVEVIVLASGKLRQENKKHRMPPSKLADTQIFDDLIAPAVSEKEWDALR